MIKNNLGMALYFMAVDIVAIYVSLIGIAFLWPGQGDLTLSPEGFEVGIWPDYLSLKYKWSEVSNFRLGNIAARGIMIRVCFDVVGNPKKKRNCLRFHYDPSLEEMIDLMNEWKEKYDSKVVSRLD